MTNLEKAQRELYLYAKSINWTTNNGTEENPIWCPGPDGFEPGLYAEDNQYGVPHFLLLWYEGGYDHIVESLSLISIASLVEALKLNDPLVRAVYKAISR